jgi:hypothetical protein
MAIAVTTTESMIYEGEDLALAVKNLGPVRVWVGTAGVTPGIEGDGYPIDSGEVLYLNDRSSSTTTLSAITEADTAYVAVIGS